MTAALLRQPALGSDTTTSLHVDRQDITFRNVAPDVVRIGVTIQNRSDQPSPPTQLTLQTAPLGAFVPWRDLTSLPVPSIQPFGSVEVSTDVPAPPRQVLGDFGKVPPQRLLTAIAGDDDSRRDAGSNHPMLNLLRAMLASSLAESDSSSLSADPFQLLGRTKTHWAGNINILIGAHAVERHMAQALRVYPGVTNLAMFLVGQNRDEYRFDLAGSGASWEATLFDISGPAALFRPGHGSPIPLSQWVQVNQCGMMLLAVCPPEFCTAGSVEVHVSQLSTGREAIVEFSLDPNAAGTGCYTV